jgi:tellurite resistance protein TehA-like permease
MPVSRIFASARVHLSEAGFPYAAFAAVMATGIVSIAAGLEGLGWISGALFCLDEAAFLLLLAVLLFRFCAGPRVAAAELFGGRGPISLTLVAALCVLGNKAALAGAPGSLIDASCVAAVLLWAAILYAIVARKSIPADKPDAPVAIDGTWLLLVVATEGVAILVTRASPMLAPSQARLFIGLALFLLGAGLYAVLIAVIVARWLFRPLRPEQMQPSDWINMGAAAIATLAGVRLLSAIGSDPLLGQLRDAVFAATILLWTVASWWIPLLAGLTLWRRRRGVRPGYRLANWAMVFPLGMYTTASWRLAHDAGVSSLAAVPDAFIWVALAAWTLTFAGMVRAGLNRSQRFL